MTDSINGKFKIILQLKEVPEFTIVTKPTGTKPYEVRHKLPVYTKEKSLRNEIEINIPDWCICLVSDGGVNVEFPETDVAVHFDSIADMYDFVNELENRSMER